MTKPLGPVSAKIDDWRFNGMFLIDRFTVPRSGTGTSEIVVTLETPQFETGSISISVTNLKFATAMTPVTAAGWLIAQFAQPGATYIGSGYRQDGILHYGSSTLVFGQAGGARSELNFDYGATVANESATSGVQQTGALQLDIWRPFSPDQFKPYRYAWNSVNTSSQDFSSKGQGRFTSTAQIGIVRIAGNGVSPNINSGVVEVWGTKARDTTRI